MSHRRSSPDPRSVECWLQTTCIPSDWTVASRGTEYSSSNVKAGSGEEVILRSRQDPQTRTAVRDGRRIERPRRTAVACGSQRKSIPGRERSAIEPTEGCTDVRRATAKRHRHSQCRHRTRCMLASLSVARRIGARFLDDSVSRPRLALRPHRCWPADRRP